MNIEGQFRQAEEDNGLSWVLNANVGKLFFALLHNYIYYIITIYNLHYYIEEAFQSNRNTGLFPGVCVHKETISVASVQA